MSKSKDGAVSKPVLDYLMKQNRPYSAIDIFNNLHKEHGKTAIIRALELLTEEKKIKEKTYGKQKIYFPEQNQFPDVAEEDLRKMDAEVNSMTTTFDEINQSIKTNESLLGSLNSSLTTSDAEVQLGKVLKEISALEMKLKELQSNLNTIDPRKKDAIYADNKRHLSEWKKRKRLATDVIDAILEGYPKGKKALHEELGLETDEDAKVSQQLQ